jgi:tetratricopeptide (TPR) repeat protein
VAPANQQKALRLCSFAVECAPTQVQAALRGIGREVTLTMPHDDQFEFDVFISCSSKDEDWVEKTLLPRIEQAGVKVCIHYRDFKPGRPALFNMQDAVRDSRHTLLVLTENWFGSEWTLFESVLTATRDPAGIQQRTIPLQLRKCELPENADFIAALTHVDFTRLDREDIAWRQLLTALGKPPEPEPPQQPARDEWYLAHPYPMPPNFTGRVAERAMLTQWLYHDDAHPLLVLGALGGFGKSALVWHWLTHDVMLADWPRVVWWSFYEGGASFEHFLDETLNYLFDGKFDAKQIAGKNAINKLLQMLHEPGLLLVLDGFERALRAFSGLDAAYQGDEEQPKVRRGDSEGSDCDCVSPLAELFLYNVALQPRTRSKVLLTTRLTPRVLEAKGGRLLEGCRKEELTQMQPGDAVEFFRAQGIRGTHTEIEAACEPYGYHPLSLRLLAGLILSDFQQPGDIAAAKRLDVSGDLVQRQHHVLQTSYDSLTAERQGLLSRIACFRSPVNYGTLNALAESEATITTPRGKGRKSSYRSASNAKLDSDLRDLIARGLLHHDTKDGRFDLHPIVRRYVYDRLAAPDRVVAHTRLRDYFGAVPKPDKVTRLEDLAPVMELYHHTVRAGQFDEASIIYRDRLGGPLHYQLGAYQLIIDLLRQIFPEGEDRLPRLKDEKTLALTLSMLAAAYSFSGQPRRALPLLEATNAITETSGQKIDIAIGLGNTATQQLSIGALRDAQANLRRRISLAREIADELTEAIGRQELGHLLAYRGAYLESKKELSVALKMFERQNYPHGKGVNCSYRALCNLLLLRSASQSTADNAASAISLARGALELADEWAQKNYPVEREYIRGHWLLGAASRVAGQFEDAEHHLHVALDRCRRINNVEREADILIDLARLRAATGAPDEAQRLGEEALLITERSGYVLQGADVHLELAKLAISRGEPKIAMEYAQEAKALATCDGPPDYTYKVAYDEAQDLMKQVGDN